jgi:membrane protein YdbS with pleckstrin-like domain
MLILPLFFACGVLMQFYLLWGMVLFFVFIALYIFAVLYYLPRRYHSVTYQVTPARIELQKGVFFQNIFQLEFNSIIYTRCTQTLLQRLFKLCTVKLHPIGSAATLPHLPVADAKFLLSAIEETCHEV